MQDPQGDRGPLRIPGPVCRRIQGKPGRRSTIFPAPAGPQVRQHRVRPCQPGAARPPDGTRSCQRSPRSGGPMETHCAEEAASAPRALVMQATCQGSGATASHCEPRSARRPSHSPSWRWRARAPLPGSTWWSTLASSRVRRRRLLAGGRKRKEYGLRRDHERGPLRRQGAQGVDLQVQQRRAHRDDRAERGLRTDGPPRASVQPGRVLHVEHPERGDRRVPARRKKGLGLLDGPQDPGGEQQIQARFRADARSRRVPRSSPSASRSTARAR